MNRYSSKQEEFQIKPGNLAIIGFQQVLSNAEKVFVWVRGSVNSPQSVDRHKIAKMMNDSYQ